MAMRASAGLMSQNCCGRCGSPAITLMSGSYPENESRLSDNALAWRLQQFKELEHPILLDPSVLRVYPSPTGRQHDECRKGFGAPWRYLGFKWKVKHRTIEDDAPLHQSVMERFAADVALDYDVMKPHRPISLRNHNAVQQYYESATLSPY
jgi:hypothetical protein